MLSLLLLLFAGPVNGLASPRFATRQASTRTLARCWPLSEVGLRWADASTDTEVRERAATARRDGRRQYPQCVHLWDTTAHVFPRFCGWGPWEWWAYTLLAAPDESFGLPWASQATHGLYWCVPLRRGLVRVSRELGLLAGDQLLGCDPDEPGCRQLMADPAYRGVMWGVDEMRFRYRGLVVPSYPETDAARAVWAGRKKQRGG